MYPGEINVPREDKKLLPKYKYLLKINYKKSEAKC